MFEKEWHFVGLADDLSRNGDYVSASPLALPVVCRNSGGELRAFQNVCAHRHCAVVAPGKGSGKTLKCQYHGWEYGDDGRIAKLTDGVSFKGLKVKDLGLEPYRVETLGGLVFVNFDAHGASLRESLGEMASELDHFFGNHRLLWHWVNEYPVNWKIIIENAVESYHVPMLHPGTFMDYKKEEHHDHRFGPHFTSYLDVAPMGRSITDLAFGTLTRMSVASARFDRAKHIHVFPHHLFEVREIYSLFSTVEPLGPRRTRFTSFGFLPRNIRLPLINRPIQWAFGRTLTAMARRIMGEDIGIWNEVQRGIAASHHAGVLSRREERVHAFQRYVADRVSASNS
jgi:phenylpropionate dioxygenase-like ring-hydroxylating dioxygenase large terminal subunit